MADREMTNEEAIEILGGIRACYNLFDAYDEPKYAALSKAIFALKAEPKRNLEVVVNEACLNCELDCVEVVRRHDCKNYEEAKNGCNGFCKEWDTSTYTWDYCSRGAKMDK